MTHFGNLKYTYGTSYLKWAGKYAKPCDPVPNDAQKVKLLEAESHKMSTNKYWNFLIIVY